MTGRVFLVGAGPGDPDLLTVRGRRELCAADVVVHDHLVDRRLLDLARPDAELIAIGAPHGEGPRRTQAEVATLLIDRARAGAVVVRLKNGDPMLFGRGGEEAMALVAEGIPFAVVPGVSSALAVPAFAGIPVTHRDHTSLLTIVTGHRARTDVPPALPWAQLAGQGGTLVFLMAVSTLEVIVERLMAAGMPGTVPAAVVQDGTTARQRTVVGTLSSIAPAVRAAGLVSPAVFVVGSVVGFRESMAWVEQRPLFGRRVLVTRPRAQADALADRLTAAGAEAVVLPTIAIVPPPDPAPFDAALGRLSEYDWVMFTSANGVRAFLDRLAGRGGDVRSLAGARIAAIGPETAAVLRRALLQPAVVPDDYRAEGLLAALPAAELAGRRVLLPRAAGARSILPQTLAAHGALVDEVEAYRAILPPEADRARLADLLATDAIDVVTFTSSSTVRNFVALLPPAALQQIVERRSPLVACIGPVTAATARECGLAVDLQPIHFTVPALAASIIDHFCPRPGDPLSEVGR